METARLIKKIFRAFSTEVETARLSRHRWIQRDLGNGATSLASATNKCLFKKTSRPRRRRRDFSDHGGDGTTFHTETATARLKKNFLRPWWMRCDFSNQNVDSPDHGATGATFQNKAETAQLVLWTAFFQENQKFQFFPWCLVSTFCVYVLLCASALLSKKLISLYNFMVVSEIHKSEEKGFVADSRT